MKLETASRAAAVLKDSGLETPAALAREAGLSRGVISGILSGKHWPQPRTRKRLAHALGVSEDELKRRLVG